MSLLRSLRCSTIFHFRMNSTISTHLHFLQTRQFHSSMFFAGSFRNLRAISWYACNKKHIAVLNSLEKSPVVYYNNKHDHKEALLGEESECSPQEIYTD